MKNPKLIVKPFAKNGQKNVIPENYETSMESNQATWDQGFGQITMLPVAAGGLPPKGQDFNGIFNQISENIVYLSQGGRFKFSAEYAEAIGGYPKGAILQSDDEKKEYLSLIDNNKVDFNTAPDISASWKLVSTDDLLAQIAGKQPKGDYATKTELNSGLAGKQPVGNYATKTDVGLKLDKTAVVQIAGTSTTDVPSQKLFTDAITNRVKVDDFNAAMEGKFNTSDVVSSTGNSTSRVMSQKSVTDALNGKQASGDYATNTDLNNTNDKLMGIGQKWVDVTSSRVNETLYTNTTKRPISVMVYGGVTDQIAVVSVDIFVDGIAAFKAAVGGSGVTKRVCAIAIVPPGSIYRVVVQNSTIGQWCEMRG